MNISDPLGDMLTRIRNAQKKSQAMVQFLEAPEAAKPESATQPAPGA